MPKKRDLNLESSPVREMFLGKVLSKNLFPYPEITEDERETLQMVIDSIDRFMEAKGEKFVEFDEKGEQSEEYIQSLRELGLFGVIIPEDAGGFGLSNTAYSRVIQQTSRYDAATSLTIGAHSSIGMRGLVLHGNDDQKERYYEKLATGEMIAAFCLTEPGSGSDAGSIKTKAEKNDDGTWTLNGEKIWITNGGLADFFTVFARTDSEGGQLSAFIVERSFAGVANGPKEDKLGIRASSTTTVSFTDVKVPAENLLGEEGKGFYVAMSILNSGRTGLGGGCVGGMKRCIELSTRYAQERKQFGREIAKFGLIKEKITTMAIECFATESAVNMIADYIDAGVEDYSIEAAISKVYASEAMWSAANESLQIAGGTGYMKEYPYEKILRDTRINMIFEGTNEILRLYIALGGMKHLGKELTELGKSLANFHKNPFKATANLSGYLMKRASGFMPQFGTSLPVHDSLAYEARVYEKYTRKLSLTSDMLLKRYKKDILHQQFLLKRIADVTIQLFVGLAILSRVSKMVRDKGLEKTKHERAIAKIFTKRAARLMYRSLREIDRNEDELVKDLARYLYDTDGYRWDIL